MRIILVLISLMVSAVSAAQKNLVSAIRAERLNIELPAGSKQDNRLLTVSTAKWMLETEAAKMNLAPLQAEVYILPPVTVSGFDNAKLKAALRQAGWEISAVQAEKKYSLLRSGDNQILVYFDMAKKATDLYVAACSARVQQGPQALQPSAVVQAPAAPQPNAGSANEPISTQSLEISNQERSSLEGTWSYSTSSAWSINDPAASMSAGYTTHQYIFQPGGTYTFYTKQFLTVGNEIVLVRENGKYIEGGNQLQIIPLKSVIETWSKKDGTDQFGAMKGSVPREPEPVTYTFTKYYFQGLQEWSLVLQTARPTKREGPFSANDLFSNAYYYRPISATNLPLELPGQ